MSSKSSNKDIKITDNKPKDTKKIKIPITKTGNIDKRYTDPQVIKKDGTRDMRCNLTSQS
jgi:hypothetical protein